MQSRRASVLRIAIAATLAVLGFNNLSSGPTENQAETHLSGSADRIHLRCLFLEGGRVPPRPPTISRSGWRLVPGENLNFGFRKGVIWAFCPIYNGTHEAEWRIVLEYSKLEEIWIYEISQNRIVLVARGGRSDPFITRGIKVPWFAFPMHFSPRQTTSLLIGAHSLSPMRFQAFAMVPDRLAENTGRFLAAYGLYAGFGIAIVSLNIVVFAILRDRSFLFYALYVAAFLLQQLSSSGIASQFVWPHVGGHVVPRLTPTFGLAATSMIVLFHATFLGVWVSFPRILRLLVGFCALVPACMLLYLYLGDYTDGVRIMFLLLTAIYAFLFVTAIFGLAEGNRSARFYVVAWGGFFACFGVYMAKQSGLLPESSFAHYAPEIGQVWEAAFILVALGDRIRQIQKARAAAQQAQANSLDQTRALLSLTRDVARELSPVGVLAMGLDHLVSRLPALGRISIWIAISPVLSGTRQEQFFHRSAEGILAPLGPGDWETPRREGERCLEFRLTHGGDPLGRILVPTSSGIASAEERRYFIAVLRSLSTALRSIATVRLARGHLAGTWTSGLAHDIRNDLTSLMHLLSAALGPNPPRAEMMQALTRTTRRLQTCTKKCY